MANVIQIKRSSTAGSVPSAGALQAGEMALNLTDKFLYAGTGASVFQVVGAVQVDNNGSLISTRPSVNFIPGSNVTLSVSDNAVSNRADVTINATGGGTVSSVQVSGGTTGITASGGPITTSGTITLGGTVATGAGGTGLTSFTSGGAVYATSTSALTTGTLPVTAGGTGSTTFTGTAGSGVVLATGPSILNANLNTPTAINLTYATGLPLTAGAGVTGILPAANGGTGVSSLGTGVATALGTAVTGTSGGIVISNGPTITNANLGTPTSLILTYATGLPLTSGAGVTGILPAANGGTGVSSLGTGVATALGSAVTGTSGGIVLATNASLITPTVRDMVATTTGTGSGITLAGAPVASTDAATKAYVDANATGLQIHTPVVVATTGSSLTATYNNGTAGVGATLTNSGTQVAFSLDGVSPAVNSRVLVKDQSAAAQNGIYTLTTVGSGSTNWVLTRATDFDQATTGEVATGAYALVTSGSTNLNTSWVLNTTGSITIGTTALSFVEFSSPITYSAGTGLTLSSNTFSITNTSVTAAAYGSASSVPTFTVNAQGQLTAAANASIAIAGSQITSGTTGSGNVVKDTNAILTSPNLGTPSAVNLSNATNLPLTTGVTGTLPVANGGTGITSFGTGVATALGANVSGSGSIVLTSGAALVNPSLGTPSAVNLSNATNLPLTTGVTGTLPVANGGTGITSFGTGVATALGANVSGSGSIVLTSGAALVNPSLGVPSSVVLTNGTGLPLTTGVTGTLPTTNGGTGLTSFTSGGAVYATSTSALTTGTLPVTAGGTGVTTSTGSGSVVLSTSPSLTTPALSAETYSTSSAITASTSNTQGQTPLTSDFNFITTATVSPSAVTLPTATIGRRVIVVNRGANPVNIYPALAAQIDALGTNIALQIPVNGWIEFDASSTTQWYSTALLSLQGATISNASISGGSVTNLATFDGNTINGGTY